MKKFNKLYAVALSVFFSLISIPFANAAVPTFSQNTNCTINDAVAYNGFHNTTLLVFPPAIYCSSGTYYMMRVVPTSYSNAFASSDFTVKLYNGTNQLITSKTYPKLAYDIVINTNNANPMFYVTGIEISYNGIIVATRGSVPSCSTDLSCDSLVNVSTPEAECDILDFSNPCTSAPVGTFDSCNDFNILSPTSWVKCLFIPSEGQVTSLLTTFHNNLTESFIGDGLTFLDWIISPITTWASVTENCLGVEVQLTFGDKEGTFIPSELRDKIPTYDGTPFSTCTNSTMQYVSGWILNIQKFIFTVAGLMLVSNILFSAFGLKVSLFTFWRKTK